jgi:hypothetical protein
MLKNVTAKIILDNIANASFALLLLGIATLCALSLGCESRSGPQAAGVTATSSATPSPAVVYDRVEPVDFKYKLKIARSFINNGGQMSESKMITGLTINGHDIALAGVSETVLTGPVTIDLVTRDFGTLRVELSPSGQSDRAVIDGSGVNVGGLLMTKEQQEKIKALGNKDAASAPADGGR